MNKTMTITTAIVLGLVAVTGSVFAYSGGFGLEKAEMATNRMEEMNLNEGRMYQYKDRELMSLNRKVVIRALEDGDYEAWKAAVKDSRKSGMVELTEENFNTLVQIHEARMNGDCETAKRIGQELGIDYGFVMGGMRVPFRYRMGG